MCTQPKKVSRWRAFTLIELLVVIAIIGLLSSVILASLSGARQQARVTRTVSDLDQLETAMTLWMQQTDRSRWPNADNLGNKTTFYSKKIADMVTDNGLDKALSTVPEPQFGDDYIYHAKGSSDNCSSPDQSGFTIEITEVSKEDGRLIDNAIDNTHTEEDNYYSNPDQTRLCGKVRWSSNNLYYVLSGDKSF